MKKDDLAQRLMVTFLGEVQDHARALERDLLTLEKAVDRSAQPDIYKALFRTAHSLKGAAHSVNIEPIATACHQLEDLFGQMRDGRRKLDRPLLELLLATADVIRETGQRLQEGDSSAAKPLAALVPSLTAASSITVPSAQIVKTAQSLSETVEPPSPPLKEDAHIRVPAERLDALVAQSGELLVMRSRAKSRSDELAALQELIRLSRAERVRLEKRVAQLTRKQSDSSSSNSEKSFAAGRRSDAPDQALSDRNTLLRLEQGFQQLARQLAEDQRAIEIVAGPLDAEVRQMRMQPFARACEGLDRVVRDLTADSGKIAELVVRGGDTQLDRSILEGLKDPLRHLVRNAVDHGLEKVEERRAIGKVDKGRVTIAAVLDSDRVQVSVSDDGRGVDLVAVRERVRKHGVPEPADDRDLMRQIFLPRLSTTSMITEVSGRGIGLDIVKTAVEGMRGTVDVSHVPGSGATFTLTLPLTLTTIRALLVRNSGQIFAIDTAQVRRIARLSVDELRSVDGRPVALSPEGPIPVFHLADWIGRPAAADIGAAKFPAVVLAFAGAEVAVIVDEVLAEQELLVRSLGPRLCGMRSYAGATTLSDGSIALVLNGATLVEAAINNRPHPDRSRTSTRKATRKKRLLVVDDSLTTRTLEKSILEAAGYDVLVAADGAEAWQTLQTQGADLVVSDVEMPLMDGFALTEKIRSSKPFKDIPVVLVTARETAQDKARGLQVGADAYLLKSAFDQRQLLEAIAQIM